MIAGTVERVTLLIIVGFPSRPDCAGKEGGTGHTLRLSMEAISMFLPRRQRSGAFF